MLTRSLLLAACLVASLLTSAQAQAPREIPYQGTLADGGTPVTAATPVVFRLHDAETGGDIVWAESQTVTPGADGRFTARLGSVTDLPDGFDQPLWLSVTADGTTLGPRSPLGAAPYALALYGIRVEPPSSASSPPSIAAGHPSNQVGQAAVVAGGGVATLPNLATGSYSFVGGGYDNTASGQNAVVSGGFSNTASGQRTAVGGGRNNTAGGQFATVPGGFFNRADGDFSFAAGRGAGAMHEGAFVWSGQIGSFNFLSTAPEQFLINAPGGVGVTESLPLAALHVENGNNGLVASAVSGEDLLVEGGDAVVGLYSNGSGTWGSTISLGEVDGSGALVNKWGIARRTTGSTGALMFTFGTDPAPSANDTQMRIETNGDVRADGAFTGGGADLAEFFPLAASVTVEPGQVVGLRAGRVSLSTDGAEQVAVVSSNPAFIGNPDAAEGGALVALVGQVAVDVTGDAAPGDLLVASGSADGRALAVSPDKYTPADGAVLGRVLTAGAGSVTALVGVDEAAALRDVVARQADRLDRQQAELDALRAEVQAIRDALAPRAAR